MVVVVVVVVAVAAAVAAVVVVVVVRGGKLAFGCFWSTHLQHLPARESVWGGTRVLGVFGNLAGKCVWSERRRWPGCHKGSSCESSCDGPSRSVGGFGNHMLRCRSSLPARFTNNNCATARLTSST